MKKKYPSVYKDEVKKYKGRENILKIKIPFLNCLWNDVIHLTAVHPKELKKALIESGFPNKKEKVQWFKINPKILDMSKTIVNLYEIRNLSDEKNYVPFKISDLNKYNKIGSKTKSYFRKEFFEGRRPFRFHLVPHILYKNKINTQNCKVIEV